MTAKTYPAGSGFTNEPCHKTPIVAVDANWVAVHGNRAQRRRIERELKRRAATERQASKAIK